jgi:polyisoprenoid-binding protein YceI
MKTSFCSFALALALAVPSTAERIEFTTFDQNHSTIGFAVPILEGMSQVEGKFTSFAVTLAYDDQDVTRSLVKVVIQAASIDTGIPDRDNDLRSAKFFDVANHPEIRFTSTRVVKRGTDLVVSGTLEIRGIEKQVELTCQIKGPQVDAKSGKLLLGAAASTTIDRKDFGVAWEHPVPHFVGDNVAISIHLISKLTSRAAVVPQPGAQR